MTTKEAVTLEIGGASITIGTQELFRAWLEKHIGVQSQTTAPDHFVPPLNQGEQYAGIIFGKDGAPSYRLILLPGEVEDVKWQAAIEWATKAGGELPTRREQSLLFTNLKEQFKEAYYWSSEQHSGDSGCAWIQSFDGGSQYYYDEDLTYRARAVRRFKFSSLSI